MPSIRYEFNTGLPHRRGPHITRIGESKVRTLRWYDHGRWFDLESSSCQASKDRIRPFWYPELNKTPGLPISRVAFNKKNYLLREIHRDKIQETIQWGTPYKHFSDKEVLEWLVKMGALPKDWQTVYQDPMNCGARLIKSTASVDLTRIAQIKKKLQALVDEI